jgi:uncharacterized protein (TIGR00299 family) protein
MRTLVFDGRTGASGDMLLGALVAAGADPDVLDPVETVLDVRYDVQQVSRNGIAATSVEVLPVVDDGEEGSDQAGDSGAVHDHGQEPGHGDGHEPGHGHGHDNGRDDGHGHDHGSDRSDDHPHRSTGEVNGGGPAEGHGPHRTYAEVRGIVAGMGLADPVEADALAIFEILGEGEAAVHGTALRETHFHEVGADDAIADVVGTALLLDDLDVDRVATTPVAAGGGEVSMAHGTYPVPTPAVVEIAERADWALRGGPLDEELLTPTGAAVLGHVASGVDRLPAMRVRASGYGAGTKAFRDHPNVLRAVLGETEGGLAREDVTVLETNVDDVSPEVLGGLQETLGEAGALDVAVLPMTMKKSRPGHLVKVVCRPADEAAVARRLAEETGTLGVRVHGAGHRWVASREVVTVTLDLDGDAHEVDVKVARDADGTVYDLSAEYDDALAVARATGRPIREVARLAETRWRAD